MTEEIYDLRFTIYDLDFECNLGVITLLLPLHFTSQTTSSMAQFLPCVSSLIHFATLHFTHPKPPG